MDQYMLLMFDDEIWQTFSESEQALWVTRIRGFVKEIEERIVKADPVGYEGRMITKDGVEVVDFTGDPDAVTGYFIFEAESWDEAVQLAQKCPTTEFGGRLQLRKLGH